MQVTIKDIALLAGVSHSTVSRALNDSPQISLATKDKIKKIAKSMNFEFNAGARSLKGVKTGNIAVVYEAHTDQFGFSLYLNQLFTELRHVLERMDMDAILLEGYHPETGASNIDRLLRQQKVDGFLIVHDNITKEDYEGIKSAELPLVQIHMNPLYCDKKNLNYFFTDHKYGGRLATEHLISLGCKNIITVRPNEVKSYEYHNRTLGFKDALESAGLVYSERQIYFTNCGYIDGYDFFNAVASRLNEIDGIFFQADIIAFGFLSAASEKGIKIPEDLKVIGFDDAPVCESTNPRLSTIHQPRKELAAYACDRIIELINREKNEQLTQKIISPTLILRDSC